MMMMGLRWWSPVIYGNGKRFVLNVHGNCHWPCEWILARKKISILSRLSNPQVESDWEERSREFCFPRWCSSLMIINVIVVITRPPTSSERPRRWLLRKKSKIRFGCEWVSSHPLDSWWMALRPRPTFKGIGIAEIFSRRWMERMSIRQRQQRPRWTSRCLLVVGCSLLVAQVVVYLTGQPLDTRQAAKSKLKPRLVVWVSPKRRFGGNSANAHGVEYVEKQHQQQQSVGKGNGKSQYEEETRYRDLLQLMFTVDRLDRRKCDYQQLI